MAHWSRTLRQWMTAQAAQAGRRAGPWLPAGVIRSLEFILARAGPWTPVLSRMVAQNMRACGLYSREAHHEYFARAAHHLGGIMHVFRQRAALDGRMNPALAGIVEQRILLDDSLERLRQAYALGQGVVLMGVHAANFMLVLARLNQELPITVYLRHSKTAAKQATKTQWCRVAGLQYIAEPSSMMNPIKRAEIMAEALRAGRILVITPDLVQKREDGVPVRFLDREIYLPGGPAALSLLVGAPLLTVIAKPAGARAITLSFHGPMCAEVVQKQKGWRQQATRERLQWFADIMANEFLRPCPGLWFLWGDKRWTRVFRDDSRYTRRLTAPDQVES